MWAPSIITTISLLDRAWSVGSALDDASISAATLWVRLRIIAWLAGEHGKSAHAAWKDRLQSLPESERSHFERMLSGNIPAEVYEKLNAFKAEMVAQKRPLLEPCKLRPQIICYSLTASERNGSGLAAP